MFLGSMGHLAWLPHWGSTHKWSRRRCGWSWRKWPQIKGCELSWCPGWPLKLEIHRSSWLENKRCQGHTLWPASTVDLASLWEQNRIMILPRHPTASPHGIHRQTNWALTKTLVICLYIQDYITKLYREYFISHCTETYEPTSIS